MALKSKSLDAVRPDVPVHVVAADKPDQVARINFNVPLHVRNAWKAAAAAQGRSLGDFITDAVNTQMSK